MTCKQCGACCKAITFTVPGIRSDRMKMEYFKAHGCIVEEEMVIIPMRCPHLTKDNKCDINDKKPMLCRLFKGKSGDGENKFYIPKECNYARP